MVNRNVQAYTGLAGIYDDYMLYDDYNTWFKIVDNSIKTHGENAKTLLELACGTGNMSIRLANAGYSITAIDISTEMLMIAQDKAFNNKLKIDFLEQDITDYDIITKFDSVICICDGINYVTDKNKLIALFNNVYNSLNDGGLFIFDISTYYKLKYVLADSTIAESMDDSAFIWENYYDEDNDILSFELNIFRKQNGLYTRTQEYHEQKAYKLVELIEVFEKKFRLISNFTEDGDFIDIKDYDENNEEERIFFVLKKK